MKRSPLLLVLSALALLLSASGSAQPAAPLDRIQGVYVYGSDAPNRGFAADGSIAASLDVMNGSIFGEQAGGLAFQIVPEVRSLQLSQTEAQAAALGETLLDTILNQLPGKDPRAVYAIYFDGRNTATGAAGYGGGGRAAGLIYLKASFIRLPAPGSTYPSTRRDVAERRMAHELIHGFGHVSPCAPRHDQARPGHVTDREDLMTAAPGEVTLDVGHDDYYGENVPAGCPNLRDQMVRIYHGLRISVVGDGGVSVSTSEGPLTSCASGTTCQLWLKVGSSITLAASPFQKTRFAGWSGCAASGPTCTLTLDGPRDITATFVARPKVLLSLRTQGKGRVTGTPGLRCAAASCQAELLQGETALLRAAPAPGWSLKAWRGTSCSARSSTCRIVLNASRTVTVVFQPPRCRPGQKSTASRPCRTR